MKGIYAGTFDPPTLGHFDLITRASKLCEKLYVAVTAKSTKQGPALTLDERLHLLKVMSKGISNVEIVSFSGLIVDFAKEKGADILIRGIRGVADLDIEMQMSAANGAMTGIETICLFSKPEYAMINATLVREIALAGRGIDPFVPAAIKDEVARLLIEASQR
jgi:pantetheine-phosphate adenylyltransferase